MTTEEFIDSIGKNVQAFRESKHKTQEEFAEIIGISRQALSAKENNNGNRFSVDDVVRIADYFNTSLDAVIGRDPNREQLSIGDILEFVFRVAKQYDVQIIPDSDNALYEDLDDSEYFSIPYTLKGLAIRCEAWNEAIDEWGRHGGYELKVAERLNPGSRSNEKKRHRCDMIEKQLIEDYKDVLPLPQNAPACRGIRCTDTPAKNTTQHIENTDDTDTTY